MPKKLLVVDDEKQIVKMLRSRLGAMGYEVITAGNGLECLEKAESRMPDLILLDIRMPEMDGFEVLNKLGEKFETKYIPVVMLTAASHAEDISKAISSGCAGYIVKPFDSDDLMYRIQKSLECNT